MAEVCGRCSDAPDRRNAGHVVNACGAALPRVLGDRVHRRRMKRLGLPAQLPWGLGTTNAIEALNSQRRSTVRRVSRFTTGDQALEVLVSRLDEATARAS